jgi:hypothetical protein
VILLINRQQEGLIDKAYYNVSPIREELFKAVLKDGTY